MSTEINIGAFLATRAFLNPGKEAVYDVADAAVIGQQSPKRGEIPRNPGGNILKRVLRDPYDEPVPESATR